MGWTTYEQYVHGPLMHGGGMMTLYKGDRAHHDHGTWSVDGFKPSTDITAAWEVVEKMEADGWGHKHLVHSPEAEHPGVSWTFMKPGQGKQSITTTEIVGSVPYVICLAALEAVKASE